MSFIKCLGDLLAIDMQIRVYGSELFGQDAVNLDDPILACSIVHLWKIKLILFKGDRLKHGHGQRARKRLVCLASNRKLHVIDIDLLLANTLSSQLCILPVDLCLLQNLCRVVVHELKKLIDHIFFVVLHTWKISRWLGLPCFSSSFSMSGTS